MIGNEDKSWQTSGREVFRTTHWSVVLTAAVAESPEADNALETLCHVYWYPIYAFVRRRGYSFHEAQDLTQGFFCQLLASESFRAMDPGKGRFRSFLISAMKNFLANEWDKANCLKRGGGRAIFSWDGLQPEERFRHEPATNIPAEKLLDREWAYTVVEEALRKLERETLREGSNSRFLKLKRFLNGDPAEISYRELAEDLQMSESAVKSAIFRLRRRFAELFRAEVLQTVATPEDAEMEIRYLFQALSE